MKALFTALLTSFFFTGYAQTDCKPYMPTEEGSTWELTHYSKKDKVTGSTKYELLEKKATGDDITFKIRATSSDEKGEEIYINEFEAYCREGVFEMDMTGMLKGETMAAYESMDVTVDASDYPLPNLDEAAGTPLKDGTMTVQVAMNGVNSFRMTIEVTDRLVEGRESMETTAGTFDCVKITQTVKTKMVVKIQASTIEWYAPGVGVVRSDSYDKKGRLTGYSVLTSIDAK
ncbi:MAG: hypothetical protein AB8B56_17835 [Crocinitomicaceae bacterium]